MGCGSSVDQCAPQSREESPHFEEELVFDDLHDWPDDAFSAVSSHCNSTNNSPQHDGELLEHLYRTELERQQAAEILSYMIQGEGEGENAEETGLSFTGSMSQSWQSMQDALSTIKPEYLLPAFAPVDTSYDANQPPLLYSILKKKSNRAQRLGRKRLQSSEQPPCIGPRIAEPLLGSSNSLLPSSCSTQNAIFADGSTPGSNGCNNPESPDSRDGFDG